MQKPIEQLLGVKLTSLIGAAVNNIKDESDTRVGLIASPTTIRKGLFVDALQKIGVETLILSLDDIDAVECLIRDCIAGNTRTEAELKVHVGGLIERGAERVILGCTELSVIGVNLPESQVIDPLKLVVEEIFSEANHG